MQELDNRLNDLMSEMTELNNREKFLSKKLLEYNTYLEIKERYSKRHIDSDVLLADIGEINEDINVLKERLNNIHLKSQKVRREIKKIELLSMKYYLKHPLETIKHKIKTKTRNKLTISK